MSEVLKIKETGATVVPCGEEKAFENAVINTSPKQRSKFTLGRTRNENEADFWFCGCEQKPNWFWRTMQYWILGITWKDI